MGGFEVIDEREAHDEDDDEEQQSADCESQFGQDAHVSTLLVIFRRYSPSLDENKRDNYGVGWHFYPMRTSGPDALQKSRWFTKA
jgi:hypothetical protein